MDHSYIDEHNVIARYGMGKLSPVECAGFEEHFVECAECQKQLESSEDFRQHLRRVAAEDAAHPRQAAQSAWPVWLAVRSWRPALIAAVACTVLFAIPFLFLLREARFAHSELNRAKADAEGWQRQYTQERQTSVELEKHLREAEQKAQQNQAVSGAAARLPVVASIFVLETVRSGEPIGSEPVNYAVISRTPQWVGLSVDLNDMQASKDYSATLAESSGQVLWQQSHLAPISSNALGINLPSSLLHEGDFVLTLQGRSRPRGNVTSRSYPFRVKIRQ